MKFVLGTNSITVKKPTVVDDSYEDKYGLESVFMMGCAMDSLARLDTDQIYFNHYLNSKDIMDDIGTEALDLKDKAVRLFTYFKNMFVSFFKFIKAGFDFIKTKIFGINTVAANLVPSAVSINVKAIWNSVKSKFKGRSSKDITMNDINRVVNEDHERMHNDFINMMNFNINNTMVHHMHAFESVDTNPTIASNVIDKAFNISIEKAKLIVFNAIQEDDYIEEVLEFKLRLPIMKNIKDVSKAEDLKKAIGKLNVISVVEDAGSDIVVDMVKFCTLPISTIIELSYGGDYTPIYDKINSTEKVTTEFIKNNIGNFKDFIKVKPSGNSKLDFSSDLIDVEVTDNGIEPKDEELKKAWNITKSHLIFITRLNSTIRTLESNKWLNLDPESTLSKNNLSEEDTKLGAEIIDINKNLVKLFMDLAKKYKEIANLCISSMNVGNTVVDRL